MKDNLFANAICSSDERCDVYYADLEPHQLLSYPIEEVLFEKSVLLAYAGKGLLRHLVFIRAA
jgi:hypothetical protein